MITLRPFEPGDEWRLDVQPEQRLDREAFVGTGMMHVARDGFSFSAFDETAACVAIGGVAHKWGSVGIAWAFMSPAAGRHMATLTRHVRIGLDVQSFERIEAVTLADFRPARRWLGMLGFALEADRMKGYDRHGRDMALFALVRDHRQ